MIIKKIKKRNGKVVKFNPSKIERAIAAAFKAAGEADRETAKRISSEVVAELEKRFNGTIVPEVEQVQDLIEKELQDQGLEKV